MLLHLSKIFFSVISFIFIRFLRKIIQNGNVMRQMNLLFLIINKFKQIFVSKKSLHPRKELLINLWILLLKKIRINNINFDFQINSLQQMKCFIFVVNNNMYRLDIYIVIEIILTINFIIFVNIINWMNNYWSGKVFCNFFNIIYFSIFIIIKFEQIFLKFILVSFFEILNYFIIDLLFHWICLNKFKVIQFNIKIWILKKFFKYLKCIF